MQPIKSAGGDSKCATLWNIAFAAASLQRRMARGEGDRRVIEIGTPLPGAARIYAGRRGAVKLHAMCLLVLAWQAHPKYNLIAAANRDEYHERPSAPLARWPSPHDFIAGRDLRAGGTWLGVDRQRRFGIVTNFRDLQPPVANAPSRGSLIPDYLDQAQGAQMFLNALVSKATRYSGFNLLLADGKELWYASNRAETFACPLQPGVHGLSNQFLDTPWPKLVRVRRKFEQLLSLPGSPSLPSLFAMLKDTQPSLPDSLVPAPSAISPEFARALSAPFVLHSSYGTRCSTVMLLESTGAMQLAEQRFDASGATIGETAFELAAGEWP